MTATRRDLRDQIAVAIYAYRGSGWLRVQAARIADAVTPAVSRHIGRTLVDDETTESVYASVNAGPEPWGLSHREVAAVLGAAGAHLVGAERSSRARAKCRFCWLRDCEHARVAADDQAVAE